MAGPDRHRLQNFILLNLYPKKVTSLELLVFFVKQVMLMSFSSMFRKKYKSTISFDKKSTFLSHHLISVNHFSKAEDHF